MLGIRRPGACRWKPSGLRSSSPITLFRWMPVPGTTTPEPSPFVQVVLQAMPDASITAMWVVEPSRLERKPCRKPSLRSPSRNSPVRSDCAAAIAATTLRSEGGPGSRSSRPSA